MFGKKESFNKTIHEFDLRVWLLLGLLWVLLWSLPWTTWLNSLPWLRLGLAIFIYVTPGMFFSMVLAKNRFSFLGHFLIGLAISMLSVSLLGTLGRIAHLPFGFIKSIFFIEGLAALFILAVQIRAGQQLSKPEYFSISTLTLLIIIGVFGILITFWKRIQIDDFSYLAYLTNWQNAPQLNFKEVFHNTGTVAQIRFWLAMHPMSLAFLAELSGLHGLLLIGFYFRPFFVVFAILAAYILYKDLLASEQKAITALLIQFTFLFLLLDNKQTGTMFFLRITDDKAFASFILAPIFFLAVRTVSQSCTIRSSALLLLTGWSLALIHPIILAFCVFIAGVYLGITALSESNYRIFFMNVLLLTVIILPIASLRFVDVPWVRRNIFGLDTPLKTPGSFDLEAALDSKGILTRVTYLEGTPFYGFNLELIKIQIGASNQNNKGLVFLSWSCLWILIFGFVWSLFNLKQHAAAPLVAATSLLILLCAVPYSGWLVGRFVSARMVYRAVWLLPTGLSCVVLVDGFLNLLSRKMVNSNLIGSLRKATFGILPAICFIVIGYFSANVYTKRWTAITNFPHYERTLKSLVVVGEFIETNLQEPSIFLAPPKIRDYLPGISSKSKTLIFRDVFWSPAYRKIDEDQLNLVFSMEPEINIEERKHVLSKYNIQYILFQDQSLKDYYANFPEFSDIQQIENFWIIDVQDATSH